MHLILNSFGASLRKENGLFQVSTTEGKQVIVPRDVKSISISKGARISSDAVLLAIENEIDVLFIDGTGMPQGRVWSVKYGSISDIRQKQIEFLYSTKAIGWVKEIIQEKINNQIAILLAYLPDEKGKTQTVVQRAINSMEDHRNKINSIEAEHISEIAPTIRGWEGAAAKRYFEALSELIPAQYKFEKRSFNPAQDEFNATLNYGYGMLYGKVECALIKAGIDPYSGIFHRDDYNRPALVFDVIEKYRFWIDYVVMQLFLQEAFSDECFVKTESNCLLDGLGKRILVQSVNDYLAEIVPMHNLDRSRAVHIDLYGHRLAQQFLKA
jgi:CRISPR-associated protein Cas1